MSLSKIRRALPRHVAPRLLLTIADRDDLEVASLKHRHVFAHRSSVPGQPKSWSVYRCLYCEIDDGSDTFLLYDGKWYRLTRDFVKSINEQVKAFATAPYLPAFDNTPPRAPTTRR